MAEKKDKGKLSIHEVENALKKQKIVFAFWNCSSKRDAPYQNYYLPLKKIFGKTILFDPRRLRAIYGSEKMNQLFLSLIKKEKPEYLFVNVRRDELTISTMERVKKISSNTKVISFSGDDERDFEPLKRYQALFVDCTLVAQVDYLKNYLKEGVKNVYPTFGINTDIFRPIKTRKVYDATFIGKPLKSRIEIMRFLIKNNVDLKIFGPGWEAYPEFKDYYLGAIRTEDMAKVISQSKINLSLSKNADGLPHLKGRTFEFAACKSFCLVEHFEGYLKFFKKNKEIIMVRSEAELLGKIRYYLKHEKEREKIAENAYQKAVKNHSVLNEFMNLFKELMEKPDVFLQNIHSIKEKIMTLRKGHMNLRREELKKMLGEFDYVSFSDDNCTFLKHKNYLHVYSLNKTGKEASCCDYYIYDKVLGNYLMTNMFKAFYQLDKNKLNQMLSINQIAVRKNFFLNNLDKFKEFFNGKRIDILNKENTCIISIPLVANNKINMMDSDVLLSSAFHKEFAIKVYLLMKQKKLLTSPYAYRLAYLVLKNPLLKDCFMGTIRNRKNWILQSKI